MSTDHSLDRPTHGLRGAADAVEGGSWGASDDRQLGDRALARRDRLRDLIAAQVGDLLATGEEVLHFLPALHLPPLRQRLSLPGVWPRYHRVALVLTDQRVLELLLAPAGRASGTRVHSYPLGQVAELTIAGSRLELVPLAGRRRRWQVEEPGDLRVLGELVARLRAAVALGAAPTARPVPLWHCPACGAVVDRATACRGCGSGFCSPRVAATLELAIPGGGLLYTGHRVLGGLVLGAELVLFAVVAMGLLTAPPDLWLPALGVGLAALAAIKLGAVRLSAVLADRSIPEPARRRLRWRRGAAVGAVLSVAVVATAVLLAGSLAAVVDRDLDFSAAPGWVGGFDRSDWRWDVGDADKRSEWTSREGRVMVVWAFPLDHESFSAFRASFEQQWTVSGQEPITPVIVAGLEGFRCIAPFEDTAGVVHHEVRYVMFDPEGRDAHVLSTVCWPVETGGVEAELRTLLGLARWVTVGA